MFSFEEYVIFQSLGEETRKQFAELYAMKKLTAAEVATARSFGTSFTEVWAQKQLSTFADLENQLRHQNQMQQGLR